MCACMSSLKQVPQTGKRTDRQKTVNVYLGTVLIRTNAKLKFTHKFKLE